MRRLKPIWARELTRFGILSAAILAITFSMALYILLSVITDARTEAAIVVVLWIIAFFLMGSVLFHRPSRRLWWLVIPLLLYAPFSTVRRIFGEVDMFAFVFHMQQGITLNSISSFEPEITTTVLSSIFLVLSVWFLGNIIGAIYRVLPLVGLLLLGANPLVQYGVAGFFQPTSQISLSGFLHKPIVSTRPDGKPPDLVLVYLEGLEQGFEETAYFGDIYEPLRKLRGQGQTFRGITEVEATGWTVAGMVASQCGVPLMPNGIFTANDHGQAGGFLTSNTCLGDVLATAGYRSELVLGNNPFFGGIRNFFESHGFTKIHGEAEIRRFFGPTALEGRIWKDGLEDDLAARYLIERYDELARSSDPIALVTHLNGPHGVSSAISRSCAPDGRAATTGNVIDAVRCTALSAQRIVEEISASHPNRDIVFVLMSDHLAREGKGIEALEDIDRFNTFIVLGTGIEAGSASNKLGSMVDVFPTLLTVLGFQPENEKAGLGVSLMSDQETLVERFEFEELNEIIRLDVNLGNAIW